MAKRKIIYLDDIGSTFKKGGNLLKNKSTIKRVGEVVVGSILGQLAVAVSDRITAGTTQSFQYSIGSVSSGLVSVASLGLGKENIGTGSGMIAATQLINATSSLLTGKNISQNLATFFLYFRNQFIVQKIIKDRKNFVILCLICYFLTAYKRNIELNPI